MTENKTKNMCYVSMTQIVCITEVLTEVMMGKLTASDSAELATNHAASATAHMTPDTTAGKMARGYSLGRLRIKAAYKKKYRELVAKMPQK